MKSRDPWDFSDRIDGHIDGSANYNMLQDRVHELERELHVANQIASDAKTEIDRLVAEVNDYKERYAHLRNHSVLTEEYESLHEALHKSGVCPLLDCLRWEEPQS